MTAAKPRSGKRWLAGAPALVALVGGLGTVAWLWVGAPAGRAEWYPEMADAAFEAGDYRTAAVGYSRLQQLHPSDQANTFNLARSLDAIGQVDGARSLLLRLSPPDSADGYPPAHLRLARLDLSADKPSAAAIDDAQRHLLPIVRANPADPEANFWLAVLCAARGRWDLVAGAAGPAASLRDVLAPRLARIAKAQGNVEQFDKWSKPGG